MEQSSKYLRYKAMDREIYEKMLEEYETSLRVVSERIEFLKSAPAVAHKERRLSVLYEEKSELLEDIFHIRKYCEK